MSHFLFARHQDVLKQAVAAISTRSYWSPFSEAPSPRVYGETANEDGKNAFEKRLNATFKLSQPAGTALVGQELSPFGIKLGVCYPQTDVEQLFAASKAAGATWRKAGPEAWVGVSLEILHRLNQRSFEIAYAVMHTTGQAFMMAFQAGGPHAQDRGLEAVAYAWDEVSRIPKNAHWEKPQGKNEPIKMEKQFTIVPRGIGLVIGCCTFPTWNAYPGLFASLATGNTVVVKPHPAAILPLAINVEIAREVLAEAGFDPNVVTLLAHDASDMIAAKLAVRSDVNLIDFTGSSTNGNWLERNALQAQVYTEKSGVNQIIIDSTDNFKGLVRNISFSLCLYSGQMCTAPQNIYVPKDGIQTEDGHLSFDQVAAALADGVAKLCADPAKAVEFLGAIQSQATLDRLDQAKKLGPVLLESQTLQHPLFPQARIRTPLMLKFDRLDESKVMQEVFGPISFVIATENSTRSIAVAKKAVREHGALTLSVYSTDENILSATHDAALEAGVALSINLTGAVFVNQSAAFSDYHGTGANAAANAALTDSAFVASRFRVVQSRRHA